MPITSRFNRLASITVFWLLCCLPAANGADDPKTEIQRLETEIRQQQEQLEDQSEAIEGLKKELETLKQQQEQKSETTDRKIETSTKVVGNLSPNTKVTLYGQINKALLVADDGNETNYYFVDNDNSSTRFGINGVVNATDDLGIGTRLEMELQTNPSNEVNQVDNVNLSTDLNRRQIYVYLKSKRFGEFSIGYGSTASDGTAEFDLSGTSVITYSDVTSLAGGQFFYDDDLQALSDTVVEDVFTNFDGLGRQERIRYDTPRFFGFNLAGSAVQGNAFDIALCYASQIGSFTMAGAVAYARPNDLRPLQDWQVDGSFSIFHTSGINLTVASGAQRLKDKDRDTPHLYYGKLGYRADFFDIGRTSFAVDYAENKNLDQNDDTARSISFGAVQDFTRWGTEYYIGYRFHTLDRVDANYKDINTLMTGLRVKF